MYLALRWPNLLWQRYHRSENPSLAPILQGLPSRRRPARRKLPESPKHSCCWRKADRFQEFREYAARAGSNTKWSFGDNESQLAEYAWFTSNSQNKSHPRTRSGGNASFTSCPITRMEKGFSDFGNQQYPQAYPREDVATRLGKGSAADMGITTGTISVLWLRLNSRVLTT